MHSLFDNCQKFFENSLNSYRDSHSLSKYWQSPSGDSHGHFEDCHVSAGFHNLCTRRHHFLEQCQNLFCFLLSLGNCHELANDNQKLCKNGHSFLKTAMVFSKMIIISSKTIIVSESCQRRSEDCHVLVDDCHSLSKDSQSLSKDNHGL